jgi:hypothetical protein
MSQLFYGGNLLEKENIMSKRASTSYNNKFSNIIHTISYDSSKSQNVGTYSFKSAIAKTHSDIDFFEIMVVSALDLDMACKKLVKQLQEIVQKINKNKTFYFTELKCGYDTRYLIPEFGKFEKDKIVGHPFLISLTIFHRIVTYSCKIAFTFSKSFNVFILILNRFKL